MIPRRTYPPGLLVVESALDATPRFPQIVSAVRRMSSPTACTRRVSWSSAHRQSRACVTDRAEDAAVGDLHCSRHPCGVQRRPAACVLSLDSFALWRLGGQGLAYASSPFRTHPDSDPCPVPVLLDARDKCRRFGRPDLAAADRLTPARQASLVTSAAERSRLETPWLRSCRPMSALDSCFAVKEPQHGHTRRTRQ